MALLSSLFKAPEENIKISSLNHFKSWVKDLSLTLDEKQIILLVGNLGSGKTQFVRFLVEALGGGDVCSPSFAIHNQYVVKKTKIEHIDLYRLEDEDDLESTGFWDLFSLESGIIIIEWADRLPENVLPPHWPIIKISIAKDKVNEEARVLSKEHSSQ